MDTPTKPSRRRYSDEYRRQVVAETWRGDASVSEVARRHDLNANLVFKWRQRYRDAPGSDSAGLVPIRLTPANAESVPSWSAGDNSGAGRVEMILADGHRVTLDGDVDPYLVRTVLSVLR